MADEQQPADTRARQRNGMPAEHDLAPFPQPRVPDGNRHDSVRQRARKLIPGLPNVRRRSQIGSSRQPRSALNDLIPTLDRWSRIGQPRQRCRSAQDAAGARRRAVAGAAPIARRTLVRPGWRWRGHLLLALAPAPLPLGERRPSPPAPLPLGEGRAAAGAAERFPLPRGIAAGADAPSH